MHDDKPKPRIMFTPDDAMMAQVRQSAERDRRIAENDVLNKIQPGGDHKDAASRS